MTNTGATESKEMVWQAKLVWMLLLCLVVVLTACGPTHLKTDTMYGSDSGFFVDEEAQIVDTPDHREVLDVLRRYQRALVAKDFGTLKQLISNDYYDNAGTTHTTADDYGRAELDEIFEMMAQNVESIQFRVVVKDVLVQGRRAHIDYEYRYSYQYRVGDEVTWDAGVDVNRLQLVYEQDRWRITSGL
jgi:hypothetical protein